MEAKELAGVVAQIGEAVGRAGFPDRAASLEEWEGELRSGDLERQESARSKLREVVHGMGGLLDIHYGSPEEAHRIDELIDLMWQAIGAERLGQMTSGSAAIRTSAVGASLRRVLAARRRPDLRCPLAVTGTWDSDGVTAQDALKMALRDVLGPTARSRGYKGSPPTWRRSSESGDYAVVNVQSSSWSTSHSLRCVVNIAFAPEPWLRWERAHLGDGMPKTVTESLGLYRERLHPEGTPEGTDGWWEVADTDSAGLAITDMNAQLERAGWPVLDGMFSRDAMMSRLRDGDLGMMKRSNFGVFFARAEALLLMVEGPSDARESHLAYALDNVLSTQREHAERFDVWVRAEAAKA